MRLLSWTVAINVLLPEYLTDESIDQRTNCTYSQLV